MSAVTEKIQAVLDRLRPIFERDRGGIELVGYEVDSGTVKVRLTGMCRDCGMADFTLKIAVEETLREAVPEVKKVVAVV